MIELGMRNLGKMADTYHPLLLDQPQADFLFLSELVQIRLWRPRPFVEQTD